VIVDTIGSAVSLAISIETVGAVVEFPVITTRLLKIFGIFRALIQVLIGTNSYKHSIYVYTVVAA
jgi:hypothetical protein